jgi:phospholipid/cholesterol/gamma-HCH transport system substrate-binding protein
MQDSALKFRIGVFVLATLVLLAVLVTMFSGLPGLFTVHNRYTVVLPNAAGVGAGTPVRRSGVRIGEVESIQLDNESGNVKVGLLIERKYALRKNEVAVLNRGLLGDTTIDFVTNPPPKGQAPDLSLVEPGSEIQGVAQLQPTDLLPSTQEAIRELGSAAKNFNQIAPDFDEAVKEVREFSKASRGMVPDLSKTNDEARIAVRNWGKLGERLDVLTQTQQEKLIKTLEDLDDTLNRIGRTFNDENQRNLNATLKNVRGASDSLDSITKNTDELLKESRKTMQRVDGSLTRTDEVLANLQRTTKPMADRSEQVMKNLDESTDRLNKVLADAQELMRALGRSNGTVAKLVNDPDLYNNLNDTACMVARMMPRIERMLKDFEVFADKVARHPESLGVGGVVRPGSGLK